jgi:hypothetical protein
MVHVYALRHQSPFNVAALLLAILSLSMAMSSVPTFSSPPPPTTETTRRTLP